MEKKIRKIDAVKPVQMKKKRVAAYARVSMETTRLDHSLSAQVSYYSALIQKNPGWEYAGVFADYGISGTSTERPEFQRLMAACEIGAVDIILTKSLSRFARNTVDTLVAVRHLRELGISIRFEKENIDTLTEEGELLLTLLASFAQEESRSISENCKWAIRKQFKKGKLRFGRLYGYTKKNNQIEIVQEQAAVVRYIFQEYLKGLSAYRISENLNADNVSSYTGRKWSNETIMQLLRNEKYTGNALLQKYYKESPLETNCRKNEGNLPMYYSENALPAIISQKLFDQVQEEISKRYGVEIVNGIAEKDLSCSRLHNKKEAPRIYPRRKAYWSPEQRAMHAALFNSRDGIIPPQYDLSMFMKCGVCGGNLTSKTRKYPDGTYLRTWDCSSHPKRMKEQKIISNDPRPVILYDHVIKQVIADELGLEEFDANRMTEMLSHITVIGSQITFHYKDGHSTVRLYPKTRKPRCKVWGGEVKNDRA